MNFRLIWVGPEDDDDGSPVARESASATAGDRKLPAARYTIREGGMVRCEQLGKGRARFTPVANFTARIVRDLIVDDEAEPRREFTVEADLAGQQISFPVPAADFGRMAWVLNRLGPRAIVYPGQQQHARAAIQSLSGSVPEERIMTRMGWHRHGPDWVYLQGGGALGGRGIIDEAGVRLPAALERYRLQPAADARSGVDAIQASLRFLSVAPDRISLPLLAAVCRAPLGNVDFSMFLAGPSGVFKTALAALCQQHFGAEMDAAALPAHFGSTAGALEELAFAASDALLVVDDFVPVEGAGQGEVRGTAERLFRAVGNRQGRGRMSGAGGRLQMPRPPRALLLATGEQVPQGRSLRSRLLIIELRAGEVDRSILSQCQNEARDGKPAAAMAAFLSWMASRYEELQQRRQARVRDLRSQASSFTHARLPATLAELQSGWEIWLQFALEAGAIDSAEQAGLERRGSRALAEIAALQARWHLESDPPRRFLALLHSALAGGRAHVKDRTGGVPETPSFWGWKIKPGGRKWTGCGRCIGWIAAGDLYLDSSASYQTARQEAGLDPLSLSEQTLRAHLCRHGLLVSVDSSRQTLLVRRTLEGSTRHVLHFRTADFAGAGGDPSPVSAPQPEF